MATVLGKSSCARPMDISPLFLVCEAGRARAIVGAPKRGLFPKMIRFNGFVCLVAVIIFFAAMPRNAAQSQSSDSPVVLTIAGDIENTNRGKFDPFRDGFLKYHEKEFTKAFEITRARLLALPQMDISIRAETEAWKGRPAVQLSGPKLSDVLDLAGAGGKPVTLYALDGYGAQFSVEKLSSQPWVLALTADGRPLGIGDRGPLWVAYATRDKPATEDEVALWVWSVFYIEVGDK